MIFIIKSLKNNNSRFYILLFFIYKIEFEVNYHILLYEKIFHKEILFFYSLNSGFLSFDSNI
jgi:hypothetical protein